jgi:curved DNA-binding protein
MQTKPFVDYYEFLECSPNASLATIERLFRHLAREYHTAASESGDASKLEEVMEIFQTLKDPQQRAEYDREYWQQRDKKQGQDQPDLAITNDTDERTMILSALYARRRNNMKTPGLSQGTIASLTGCDESVTEFHLWYFMQKGWIMREESGVVSITALGIDRIDEINLALKQNGRFRAPS